MQSIISCMLRSSDFNDDTLTLIISYLLIKDSRTKFFTIFIFVFSFTDKINLFKTNKF